MPLSSAPARPLGGLETLAQDEGGQEPSDGRSHSPGGNRQAVDNLKASPTQ